MQKDTLVAVDIAKDVFEVGVSDRPGRVARRSRPWRLEKKLGHNKAAVALANKLARITWAV